LPAAVSADESDLTADGLAEDAYAVLTAALAPLPAGDAGSGGVAARVATGARVDSVAAAGGVAAGAGVTSAASVPVVLIGHSMGASIATVVAAQWGDAQAAGHIPAHAMLAGLVMLDMAEEYALAAIPHMTRVLASLPASFPSREAGVEWALGTVLRLRASASVSIPYQLRLEGEEWRWRAAAFMRDSAPMWEAWFRGTDARFLSAACPKLLVLSAIDALDAQLSVGHMQGACHNELSCGRCGKFAPRPPPPPPPERSSHPPLARLA
jgi:pimeloyl-ACP methyl ester carboxylesterase